MRIIIVGCGKVGSALAEQLSAEGHELTLIDLSERRLEKLTNRLDLTAVAGSGTSYQVLLEAGVQDTDLVIAVTAHDEINLLSCLTARKASGCHAIARVRDPQYVADLGFIRDELGISMAINPELSTARVVSRLMRFPSAIGVSTFARGRIELLDIRIPAESRLDGMAVCEVNPLLRTNVLLCMVRRGETTYIPKGDFILHTGDDVTVIIPPKEQKLFFDQVGVPSMPIKTAMLVGGGKIAFFLAKILLDSGISVKIIENRLERCEFLSEKLPAATVIHGDGTDRELLDEEGLSSCGAFVSLTGMDEENILISMYAQSLHAGKVITKINRLSFLDMLGGMGLDTIVSPKNVAANRIIRYVRAMHNSAGSSVQTLYKIVGGQAEALEFIVADSAKFAGIPLKDLKTKPNVLIACIIRNSRIIIPRGGDALEPRDSVVVVTANQYLRDLSDILA